MGMWVVGCGRIRPKLRLALFTPNDRTSQNGVVLVRHVLGVLRWRWWQWLPPLRRRQWLFTLL